VILRLLLAAVGLAALLGSLAIDRPERFAITVPCAVLTLVLAAGAIAGDAVPVRRVPLACSIASLLLAIALAGIRSEVQIPIAAAMVAAPLIAVAAARREAAPARASR
jgi:hypothetical protein